MSKTLIVDLQGWSFWACPCVAEWWPLVQRMAVSRGLVKVKLDVSQGGYNIGGVSASAGTHDGGGVLDLRQYSAGVVRLLREAGAAAWHRGYPEFPNNEHTHLVLIGCPHLQGRPTASRSYPIGAAGQVESYKAGRDGLAMNGPDNGPQVYPVRTWREGVAWMRAQLTPAGDGPGTSITPGVSDQAEQEFTVAQFDEIMKELATIKAVVIENQARIGVGKGEASIAKRVDLGNAIGAEQQARLGVARGQTLTGILAEKAGV